MKAAQKKPRPQPKRAVDKSVGCATLRPAAAHLDNKEAFVAQFLSPSGMDDGSRPKALGIHHLKFAVSNLDVSIAWYERVLGARRIPRLDHIRYDGSRFAAVCEMVDWTGLYLELRESEGQAQKDRGWDPVTLSVEGRVDLFRWIDWLDRWGTTHSPVLAGVRGWLLLFEDPDRRRFRMYTRESHGGTEPVSPDEYWLNEL